MNKPELCNERIAASRPLPGPFTNHYFIDYWTCGMFRMFLREGETMWFKTKLVSSVCLALIIALMIHLAGCGTIIYPERRGQTGGHIDTGIAILDAQELAESLKSAQARYNMAKDDYERI
jgi:uncharacterized protein YceK